MKSKIKTLLVITFLSTQLLFAQNVEKKFVTIDKVKIAYKTFGLETRKGNEPILVFESGMGGGSFEQIFEYLPKNVAGIEYGRNGLGESEIDTAIKTDVQVVERLHSVCRQTAPSLVHQPAVHPYSSFVHSPAFTRSERTLPERSAPAHYFASTFRWFTNIVRQR